MKDSITMLNAICRQYKHDTSHKKSVDNIDCVFLTEDELKIFYAGHGFTITERKYVVPAWDKHIESWKALNRADRRTIDGTSGVLIQLSTA